GFAAPPSPAATPPGAPQGPLMRRVAVTLRGPLEESVAAAMPPGEKAWAEQLTQVVNRLLVWNLHVSRDARKGDKLEVLYELPTAVPTEVQAIGDGGPATKEPVVLALRYGSQKLGKLLTAYRFKPEGSSFAHYYTSDGVDVEEHLVDGPIDSWEQVTSLLRDGRRHKGVDYKTPVGTPVKAPFDGTITRRNWKFSANGNCLEIEGPGARRAIFLHLEAVPKEMQPGRKVKKGEVVAKSGNSGHSTAPHLHYQLEGPDGKVLDPFTVHATRSVKLEGGARAAFEAERQRLDPMLVAAAAR
ncbi:MAG TPA: M23 family metallopeptidase, partial [Anaeromyxobacteraceae bacterium]|nr:M23 family metallopeptidase [Anaeromyxobacteraceae bacterium]